MLWSGRLTKMRRILLLVVPALVFVIACSDVSTPSSTDVSTSPPTAVASAEASSPSPTHAAVASVAPVQAPPQDPYAAATAAGATAVCAEGTWSYSKNRSGTCSSHGGVHWWTGNLGPAGPGAH